MSPKKKSSKKTAARRASSRKEATTSVGGGKASGSSNKPAAKKPQPLTLKPDQMDKDVLEFIQAIDEYKRTEGRPFPTWSEILDVIKDLGYQRRS